MTDRDVAVAVQFRVKIVEARQLAGANISPVCRMQCHKQAAQTRIKHSTNAPFWNETFFFSFHLPPAELFDEPIEFQVARACIRVVHSVVKVENLK